MKATVHYDEKAALEIALQKFRRYNKAMYFSLNDTEIDNRLIERIFKAKSCSKEETDLKLILRKVAVNAIYMNPNIPENRKEAQAKKMAQNIDMVIAGSKNDYIYETGGFGSGTEGEQNYKEAQKAIPLVQKAVLIDLFKDKIKHVPSHLLKRESIKTIFGLISATLAHGGIASTIAGTAAAKALGATLLTVGGITITPIVLAKAAAFAVGYEAVNLAFNVIPLKYKLKMKSIARDALISSATAIRHVSEKIITTAIGQKVANTYNTYVAPIINKGRVIVEAAYNKTKSKLKKALDWSLSWI